MWTLMCLLRYPDCLNALWHTSHSYGFSPVWILWCTSSWCDCANRWLQTLHSNGFIPEWLCLCVASRLLLWQHRPHSVHLYLPVCIFLWIFSLLCDIKRFPHSLHEYNFSPLCISTCAFKFPLCENRFSHTLHTYGLGLPSCECWVISLLSSSNAVSSV